MTAFLVVERQSLGEDRRRYFPDADITDADHINWDRDPDSSPEERTPEEVEQAMGYFAIEGLAGFALWPRCLEARIDLQTSSWETVEPELLRAMGNRVRADEVVVRPSPQDVL
jgi:hypothetical protein